MATHAPVEEPSTAPDIASSGVQTLRKLAHLRQYALFEKLHAAAYHRVGGEIALLSTQPELGASACDCARAADKVLGTPSCDEHGSAVAQPEQTGRGRSGGDEDGRGVTPAVPVVA